MWLICNDSQSCLHFQNIMALNASLPKEYENQHAHCWIILRARQTAQPWSWVILKLVSRIVWGKQTGRRPGPGLVPWVRHYLVMSSSKELPGTCTVPLSQPASPSFRKQTLFCKHNWKRSLGEKKARIEASNLWEWLLEIAKCHRVYTWEQAASYNLGGSYSLNLQTVEFIKSSNL